MTHIEFVGPPGAGKSTIHSQLINRKLYFGGVREDAIRRVILKTLPMKFQIPYRILPTRIKNYLDKELFRYRIGNEFLIDFIAKYPQSLGTFTTILESAEFEKEDLFRSLKKAMERFEVSKKAKTEGEIICLDRGFAQIAVSIMWRSVSSDFSLEEFVQNLPIPKILVHIKAPTQLCLDRQYKRGKVIVTKDWLTDDEFEVQKKLERICSAVANEFSKHTSVIEIENTNNINDAVQTIDNSISKI